MNITNESGLPESIVKLVSFDGYEQHGPGVVSVTTLTRPPQINYLEAKHAAELTEDAADRIWATYGTLMHTALQHAAPEHCLVEERMTIGPYAGNWSVTGQPDLYDPTTKILTDFKFVSVWAMMDGIKPEWEFQLNAYAELLRCHGHEVDSLQIVTLYRDWSKTRAFEHGYPQQQAAVHHVSMWPRYFVEQELERLTQEYADAMQGKVRDCTPEERWHKEDKWAAVKRGNKKAARLLDSEDAARQWGLDNIGFGAFTIEHRPGADPRCENYCAVSAVCPQFGAKP